MELGCWTSRITGVVQLVCLGCFLVGFLTCAVFRPLLVPYRIDHVPLYIPNETHCLLLPSFVIIAVGALLLAVAGYILLTGECHFLDQVHIYFNAKIQEKQSRQQEEQARPQEDHEQQSRQQNVNRSSRDGARKTVAVSGIAVTSPGPPAETGSGALTKASPRFHTAFK